jgi:hypothetical protein
MKSTKKQYEVTRNYHSCVTVTVKAASKKEAYRKAAAKITTKEVVDSIVPDSYHDTVERVKRRRRLLLPQQGQNNGTQ